MASGDVSALLDIAGSAPQVDPAPVDTPDIAPLEETPESTPADGAQPEAAESTEKPIDARTNPKAIREALKTLRDSSPENAPIARELNNIVGRHAAYKAEFPTVAEARDAKALLTAVGGNEGLAQLQATIKDVGETDAALYAGDPKVLDNLIEDMRSEGKLDAFTKLAGPFLDKLRSLDAEGYIKTLKPHFHQGLVSAGLPKMLQLLTQSLSGATPDVATTKALVSEMADWYESIKSSIETDDKTKLDPDRQAFEKERSDFQTTKQKEFNNTVGTACETHNNRELGLELGKYFKTPFFKTLPLASRQDLASGIKNRLFSELKADKTYQSQMEAFFSSKSPDREKIERYHEARVKTMAARVVKSVIETRYPNHSKVVAMRPAAASPAAPAAAAAPASSKPVFVTAKPAWEQLDMDKDPQRMLFASGRGYRKSDGKFITWNPKFK